MCLIVLAYRAHPRYALVLAANRDEFHRRPSAAAAFWPEQPRLLAGRDLQQGGSWCGITREGRYAAVTNYRDPSRPEPGKRSRGLLVRNFLLDTAAAAEAAGAIERDKAAYSDFNLLLGDRDGLFYVGSRAAGPQPLAPGLHGLSNGQLDFSWPKVRRAGAALERVLAGGEVAPAALFELLAAREPASDAELPDTGVGHEMERFLSPVFIQSETYGTRCSTVMLIGHDGRARFCERRFSPAGAMTGETDEAFELAA